MSQFKYLGYVLDKSGTDEAECHRKGVGSAIRALVNGKGLQFDCPRVSHEPLLILVMYASETDMEGDV